MKSPLTSGVAILFLSFSVSAQTNEWTKPTSGSWEELYWSLGTLPGAGQQLIAVDNYGWKAVAIGENTTANFPGSLTLSNLLVEGPGNSSNTLLLNWAKLSVPLVVQSNLIIGTNASLVSRYSALQVANADISGSASFMDYATEDFGQLTLQTGATLGLTNGTMTCSNLTFYEGSMTQSGGTFNAGELNVPLSPDWYHLYYGYYYLQGGALSSQQLTLGSVVAPFGQNGNGSFFQTGGLHTNSVMNLWGYYKPGGGTYAGSYWLQNGILVSGSLSEDGGYFVQSGGTNIIQQLNLNGGSYFGLSGGRLIVSNITALMDLYVNGRFEQSGGEQIILSKLLVQGGNYGNFMGEYRIFGGSVEVPDLEITGAIVSVSSNGFLVASNINLQGGLRMADRGVLSNIGVTAVSGHTYPDGLATVNIDMDNPTEPQYLGALQIFGGCTIKYSAPSNSNTLRFADSHTLPWTGPLQVWLFGQNPGVHIFFGTNAQALSPGQLAQVQFIRYAIPQNLVSPAILLPTGELVPALPPPLGWTNSGQSLVLTWSGGYQLLTATNPAGPYSSVPAATSPFTNTFTNPQRFYRLQPLGP